MKNILILSYNNSQSLPGGGIEKYTKNLIKILTNENYNIFEINFYQQENINFENIKNYEYINHKIKFFKKPISIFKLPFLIFKFAIRVFKFNRLLNKTIKEKNIDIVIDETMGVRYIKRKRINYIWVAHDDVIKIYNNQNSSIWIKFRRLLRLQSCVFFKFKKIVIFTQKDKEELLKINKKINPDNIFTCPLSHKNLIEINNFNFQDKIDNARNIIYMGRLYQNQKNISFIAKIAEKLNNLDIYIYIYIYGDGPDKNMIINKPGIKYQGAFNKSQVDEILKDAKLLILPTLYEGFPYAVVEALSNGVPCLVANTFNNASYLVDETRGKCIDNFDVDYWVKEIEFFQNLSKQDYLKFSKNALNFARANLTNDKFKDFWLKLIKEN